MEVSNREFEAGEELIQKLVSLTGLPVDPVRAELEEILKVSGHTSTAELSMDDLRAALLVYLDAVQDDLGSDESPCLVPNT
jgi:hypothetical protein